MLVIPQEMSQLNCLNNKTSAVHTLLIQQKQLKNVKYLKAACDMETVTKNAIPR